LFFASLFGLFSAFAPNLPTLLVTQILTGFGLGGDMPVDTALFAEFLPKEKRGQLMVLLSSFWILE
jgi:putative MFS transporter